MKKTNLYKLLLLHVDSDDEVVLGLSLDIIQSLVANIHENGWQVGHHEDTEGIFSFKLPEIPLLFKQVH